MRVKIKRFTGEGFRWDEFEVPLEGKPTVLEVLSYIKENIDPTLSFRAMCRASICGTCALKINGQHKLACNTRAEGEEITIEPVDNSKPVKDLVVSHEEIYALLKKSKAWIEPKEEKVEVSQRDLLKTSKAWDCILCGICNNVCPPLAEGKDFGGPMVLTRVYKVLEDPRDGKRDIRLGEIVSLNVQECVHCSNCNLFCPKGCMPERWITLIEGKLLQRGLIRKKMDDFGFLG